jgi:hypothetical protein
MKLSVVVSVLMLACYAVSAQQPSHTQWDSLLFIQRASQFPYVGKLGIDQNYPNPCTTTQGTTIRYLAIHSTPAYLYLYTAKGDIVLTKTLNNEVGTVRVLPHELKPGIYTYALIVHGRVVERKKLIVSL